MNINGAINLGSKKVSAIEVDSIDAQTVVSHLKEMSKIGIYIILDNARYYCSKVVKAFLEENPRVVFKFLPPYCPNPNIIERLCSVMKR